MLDFLAFLLSLSSLLWIIFLFFESNFWLRRSSKLPPGPFPVPIIGNLLRLGPNPHRSLAELSKTYGPLMHLKLGSKQTVVVSSPEMAKQILQKHDQICSGRAVPIAARVVNHHEASVAWLPVGDNWRKFRKICRENIFTMPKLEASKGLRQEKLQQLRDYLEECCNRNRVVNIGKVAHVTSLNLMSATLFSMDFANFDSTSAQEIEGTVRDVLKIVGTPNLADYFPVLELIDPQGLKRKAEIYTRKLLEIFDEIICKRLESRALSSDNFARKKDLLEVLLDLNQENDSNLSRHDIKHIFLDLIVAGGDTTSGSVQWALAQLLRNPEKMSKAKNELRAVIGEKKQVEESDIPKLPYLNAVIKETFRCHPPGPFLIPHKAEDNVEINGYTIPKGAQIIVNVWAIGRDSRIWSNPDSFEPERFSGSKIDYRGQDFELITFGSGRRMCPGMPLAHLMVHLMLASMIHNFEWKVEEKELDMSELFGMVLQKAAPLKAVPIKH